MRISDWSSDVCSSDLWAVRLILVTLAVTPFRRLLRWPKLVMLRRQIGVAAMCYALLHLTLYTASEAWMLGKVVQEIVSRFYLTIGFVAVFGLVDRQSTRLNSSH